MLLHMVAILVVMDVADCSTVDPNSGQFFASLGSLDRAPLVLSRVTYTSVATCLILAIAAVG